jgi:hypothetical protein
MKLAIASLALSAVAFAAIEGVVTNQTTGKPQAGVAVTVVELGQGMKSLGTTKTGGDGKFTLPGDFAPASPHLIQAQHEGVNYNRMLQPGTPGSGLTVEVFDSSSTQPRDAQVSQHMFLLEPTGSEMLVSERIVYTNSGNVTFNDPSGSLKFYVPEGVSGAINVRIQAPQGMPITRPAEKSNQPNVYVLKYPMKPGETNVDVSYTMPMSGSEAKFAGKILHGGGPVRFVAPQGVKLTGPFQDEGPIPGTSATAYTLKGSEFALTVAGTGSLRASANPEGGNSGGNGGGDDTGPGIEARKPLIYDRLPYVLAFSFAMLAVGFVMLFRRTAPVRGRR